MTRETPKKLPLARYERRFGAPGPVFSTVNRLKTKTLP